MHLPSTYLLVTVNYTVQAKSLIVSKRAMARLLPKLVTSSEATPCFFFIYFMQVQKPADSVFVHAAMSVLPNKKKVYRVIGLGLRHFRPTICHDLMTF